MPQFPMCTCLTSVKWGYINLKPDIGLRIKWVDTCKVIKIIPGAKINVFLEKKVKLYVFYSSLFFACTSYFQMFMNFERALV